MYEGTKIFVSGLTQAMTQRFYNLVLLPRIRDDLAEFKVITNELIKSCVLKLTDILYSTETELLFV